MKNVILFIVLLFASRQVLAADMYINPATTYLEAGKTAMLEVVSGTEPFRWTWQDKDGQLHNFASEGKRRVYFSAPSDDAGIYQIFVKDATDITAESLVIVYFPIRTNKQGIYLKPGDTARLAATGGVPPYTLILEAGTSENNAEYFYVTAPNIIGDYYITVRDSIGNTRQIKVYVTSAIRVTPNIQYMEKEGKVIYEVKGGVPPYTGIILYGDYVNTLEPDMRSENGIFTFTAGNVPDKDIIIQFSDLSGQTIQAHAWVQRQLRLTARIMYVDINSAARFKIYGGTGGYTVVTDGGIVTIDSETGIGTWQAPRKFGNYEIKILDSSGNSKVLIGRVEPMNPVISPSSANMKVSETKTFMVTRGVPPYEWEIFYPESDKSIDDKNIAELTRQNEGQTVIEVAIYQPGNYILYVQDNAGNETDINITVSP
jgi:hypothetical protein